jgi:hypothetical protein
MTKKISLRDQVEKETTGDIDAQKTSGKTLKAKVQKTTTRRKSYTMDLRVHSPASLGYLGIEGIDTAPAMVRLATVKGLDMIAVTDYYSGDFIDRAIEAAQETSLTIIPGTAIRCGVSSCDDIVLLCLFPEGHGKVEIEQFLLELGMSRKDFGNRDYVVQLPFEDILDVINAHGGEALPSRMDKTPYRMGAIPVLVEEYGFRAFDLAYGDSEQFFKKRWPKMNFQLFSFSNANALAQVGSRTAKVKMPAAGFEGIRGIVARDAITGL